MKASFKFVRMKNGVTAFAEVGVESQSASEFAIEWAKEIARCEAYYPGAVSEGIGQAFQWHRELGGPTANFTVTEFVDLAVDTKADAVRCAATAAAWKALGHSENELLFDFDGEWRARKAS